MGRTTVALGLVAAAAVTTAVVVTVTGNSSSGTSKERVAVGSYIKGVDQVEQQMAVPLAKVLAAFREFSRGGTSGHDPRPGLAAAERTLQSLQLRISAIRPPPQAVKLRRLVIGLVSVERQITREVDLFATFTPRYRRQLELSRLAGVALSKELAATKIPKPRRIRGTKKKIIAAQRAYAAAASAAAASQADAIDRYSRALRRVVAKLETLRPPPALAPAAGARLTALKAATAAGSRLAVELRKKNRSRVPVLGRRFTAAARISQTVAVQRAEIAAIKRYNVRAHAVNTAAARVQQELARLGGTLP